MDKIESIHVSFSKCNAMISFRFLIFLRLLHIDHLKSLFRKFEVIIRDSIFCLQEHNTFPI